MFYRVDASGNGNTWSVVDQREKGRQYSDNCYHGCIANFVRQLQSLDGFVWNELRRKDMREHIRAMADGY